MKTNYEKLKAFAEELNPEGTICGNNFKWNGDEVFYKYIGDDDYYIHGENECKISYKNTNIGSKIIDLDQWINETREYWREKGLPSLQKYHTRSGGKTLLIKDMEWGHLKNTIRLFKRQGLSVDLYEEELQRRREENPTGKLFEIPNTVVNLKTQDEYNEYMQMCKDIGWVWGDDEGKPTFFDYWHYYKKETCVWIRNKFLRGDMNLSNNILTLSELKQRIGINSIIGVDTAVLGKDYITYKTNAVKSATKSIMNYLKETYKTLKRTKGQKARIKAGILNEDLGYTQEIKELAQEQMLAEFMEKKEFQTVVDEITEERNSDSK